MNPELRTNRFNDGREFQDAVESRLKEYELRGIMRLKRVSPPSRVVGSGAFRKVIFLENPFSDFIGCWSSSAGRLVVIECKSTDAPRLPVNGASGVTEKQLNELRRWNIANAIAFVLWYVRPDCACWFFTVPMLQGVLNTGRKSVKPEEGSLVERGDFLVNMIRYFPLSRCMKCSKTLTVLECQAWADTGKTFCTECSINYEGSIQ